MNRSEILNDILARKVVAVLRVNEINKLEKIIFALAEGGVTVSEITMTVPNALRQIEQLAKVLGENILLGVGSVLTAQIAEDAVNAGAKYVVSPVFKKEIIDTAHRLGVPVMPGCFSPTEIQTAWETGADIIKVFPADILGMEFFKAVLAPLPHVRLMPTGGVSLTNAGDWIKAGACAVGVGSALLDKEAINEGNYFKLTANARTIIDSVNAV